MSSSSFLAGLLIGTVATLGVVLAVPDLLPARPQPVSEPSSKQAAPEPEVQPEPRPEPESKQPVATVSAAELRANATAAVATLRNLVSAQAQFQAVGLSDENENGVGEYATFAELSGKLGVRGGARLDPPVLSHVFTRVVNGRVERNGYYFRIYLPDAAGHGVAENADGGLDAGQVDPENTEVVWCCYAWPVQKGVTGDEVFFVNQMGDVLTSTDARYSAREEPPARAAFHPGSEDILGQVAIGAKGADGNSWKVWR